MDVCRLPEGLFRASSALAGLAAPVPVPCLTTAAGHLSEVKPPEMTTPSGRGIDLWIVGRSALRQEGFSPKINRGWRFAFKLLLRLLFVLFVLYLPFFSSSSWPSVVILHLLLLLILPPGCQSYRRQKNCPSIYLPLQNFPFSPRLSIFTFQYP